MSYSIPHHLQAALTVAGIQTELPGAQVALLDHGAPPGNGIEQLIEQRNAGVILEQQLDHPATRQAKAMSLIGLDPVFELQGGCLCGGLLYILLTITDKIILNAAARNRAHDLAILIDGHHGADRPWRRTPGL